MLSSMAFAQPTARATSGRFAAFSLAVTAAAMLAAAACGSSDPATEPSGSGGADLYAQNCASCHGADLGGTDDGPSHLSSFYEPNHHGDDAFRSAISNGSRQHHWNFGDMPPVTGLTDAEVDDIISYVRSEQERRGFD